MKRLILIAVMIVGVTSLAQLKENTGLGQVMRRHSMRRVEKPVDTRVQGDSIVHEFADGSVRIGSASVFVTSDSIKQQVESLKEDKKILSAAKEMIQRMKVEEPEKLAGLSDSQIVKVADNVLETSSGDAAVAGVIGALIGAAAAGGAAVIGKDKGKEKEVGDERKAG